MTRYRTLIPVLVAVAGCGTVAPAPEPAKASPGAAAAPRAPAAAPPQVAAAPPKAAVTPKVDTPPAPKAAPSPAPRPATSPPPKAALPPLDLKSLEQRLKETSAIGVLTKLSLKNQVDDLVARFKAFHDGTRPPTLAELRPAFELLIMKVLTLLQDHDKALANDINASRDAIWGVLTDRRKLATHL